MTGMDQLCQIVADAWAGRPITKIQRTPWDDRWPAPNADARLLALIQRSAAFRRDMKATRRGGRGDWRVIVQGLARMDVEVGDEIARTPAHTLRGARAKAMHVLGDEPFVPESIMGRHMSAISDLLRSAGEPPA